MSSGSRFIAAAVAALVVSVAAAGVLGMRRADSRTPVTPLNVSAEPTPTAVPSPVASPAVEPAAGPSSASPHRSEAVQSKPASPKPTARMATAKRTPASLPTRPAIGTDAPRPAARPAMEPVVEAPNVPPAPPPATKPMVDPAPPAPAAAVATVPVEIPRRQLEEHTVKADSVVGIRLDQSLSSATAKLEDRVSASVSRDVIVDGRTVLPTGTRLEGNVTLVQPGSKFRGRARLGIRFHTLVLADGLRVPIQTEAVFRDGESATGATATKVGTGAAAGAIIGAVLGGKRGAIIGAGVGAGGGTAAVMAGDAKDALLESGTPLTIRLTSPLTLTIERDSR
jgi:hypothetical protein